MRLNAEGILHHHFHGTYTASVGLRFESPEDRALAQKVLGDAWKVRNLFPRTLTWSGDSDALRALKDRFRGECFALLIVPCGFAHCENQCTNAEIDGVPHSIDVGPPFTLLIEVENPGQGDLFGGYGADASAALQRDAAPRTHATEIRGSWYGVEIPAWLRFFDCRGESSCSPWGELHGDDKAKADLGLLSGASDESTFLSSCSGRSYLDVSDEDMREVAEKMVRSAEQFLASYEDAVAHPGDLSQGGSGHYKPVAVALENRGWTVLADRRVYATKGFGVRMK